MKKPSQMDLYWYRKNKIDNESFIFMYLFNLNCNSFISSSIITPTPLTLGTPKTLEFLGGLSLHLKVP